MERLLRADRKCTSPRIRTLLLAGAAIVALASVAGAGELEVDVSGLKPVDSIVVAQAGGNTTRTTGRCKLSGCGHEICADESVITPCIWRPEFGCYKTALCEVQSDGKCGWTMTAQLEACLTNASGSNRRAVPAPN